MSQPHFGATTIERQRDHAYLYQHHSEKPGCLMLTSLKPPISICTTTKGHFVCERLAFALSSFTSAVIVECRAAKFGTQDVPMPVTVQTALEGTDIDDPTHTKQHSDRSKHSSRQRRGRVQHVPRTSAVPDAVSGFEMFTEAEVAKREARGQRFGLVEGSIVNDAIVQELKLRIAKPTAEQLIVKKRADRFGLEYQPADGCATLTSCARSKV